MPEPHESRRNRHRRRSRAAGAVLALSLGALSAALPVLAQDSESTASPADGEITVTLSLAAPEGCGTEADLAARITWRTNRVRFVPVGASERRLEVAVTTTENSATATLALTLPNGRRATRTLRAATCDEAIDAAALVAAVTLDPAASTDSRALPDAGAGAPEGSAGTGGAPAAQKAPPPAATARDERPPMPPPRAPYELSGAIFGAGEVVVAPAPEPLLGGAVGASLVWDGDTVLSPALRVSLAHYPGQRFEARGGTALFRLTAVTLDACPFRIGDRGVRVFACGSFTLGSLHAAGRRTIARRSVNRRWTVAGGTLLGQWRPSGPLEFSIFGTLGPPLVQDAFSFEPEVFHQVPTISGRAGIGFGWFFR